MRYPEFTEKDLESFRGMLKWVKNPGAQWKEKPRHEQKNFDVISASGDTLGRFLLFCRRRAFLPEENFSCGLVLILPGKNMILVRYNSGHVGHGKEREGCHIHRAREEDLRQGRKPDYYAEPTDRYKTLDGALYCLLQDYHIMGLNAREDLPALPLEERNGD